MLQQYLRFIDDVYIFVLILLHIDIITHKGQNEN